MAREQDAEDFEREELLLSKSKEVEKEREGNPFSLSDCMTLASNVCSSVAIVIANKELMRRYNFVFVTSLSALHFLTCALLFGAFNRTEHKDNIRLKGTLNIFHIRDSYDLTLNNILPICFPL